MYAIRSYYAVGLDQQPLEIFTFRKMQRDRVIGSGGEPAQDARITPGIDRRAGDDLLEQFV